GGKAQSSVTTAARGLADQLGRTVRVVFSREDVVRLGPKRPPIAASAVFAGDSVRIEGVVVGPVESFSDGVSCRSYDLSTSSTWTSVTVAGPPTSAAARATGLAERAVLVEGALQQAGVDRAVIVSDDRAASVLLDTCASAGGDTAALAGARVLIDGDGGIERVEVRVAAGDPLDEVVLRSYCIGATHMALGWVLSEGLAVDPETGEV